MQSELKAHWRVLGAGAAGVMLGLSALPAFVLGVFAGPMTREFGWSLGAYQVGTLFFTLGILLCSAWVGALCDRHGAAAVARVGMPLAAVGVASLGFSQPPIWTFYAAMFATSVLASGTLPITWTRMVNALFVRSRGLALGIVLSGSSLFAAFGPPLAQALIDAFGWRAAWQLLALLPLLVGWPIVYAGFRGNDRATPAAASPAVAAAPAVAAGSNSAAGETTVADASIDLRGALRSFRFWILAAGFGLVTLGVGGMNPNLVPMLTTKGFTAEAAAATMTAFGLSMFVGRLIAGYLIDRLWAPGVAAVVLCLPALSALLMLGETVTPTHALLAAGLLGFAQGAEYDFLAYLVARYFGLTHYGRIYGVIVLPIVIATGVGAVSVASVRDATGSFDAALPVVALLFVVGALLLLALGRKPR